VGFGVALYTAATSIEYVIELSSVRTRKRMEDQVAKLKEHTIVCGFGRVGQGTWNTLRSRGVEVAVIESDADRATAAEAAGALVITGDATHNSVLELAGIHSAEALIACVADDSDNLVIALSAKALRPDLRVVCRASEPESERKLRLAGADAVVSPSRIGGLRMASELVRPKVVTFLDRMIREASGSLRVEEVTVPQGAGAVGTPLRSLNVGDIPRTVLLALRRPGSDAFEFKPGPDTALEAGMTLIVMADAEGRTRLEQRLAG
jgi:voltage-gated potassium channel